MISQAPNRCDVILVRFDPQEGKEIMKTRPAVVVSPFEYNRRTSLAIVCPITHVEKGNLGEVEIPDGYPVTGVILSDQIKSIDWRKRGESLLCRLNIGVVDEVVGKVCSLIEDCK